MCSIYLKGWSKDCGLEGGSNLGHTNSGADDRLGLPAQ